MTDDEDERQLKFIEILLIVGGIIGSLGDKSENSSIRFILAVFLISSLMYYYAVSNPHLRYKKIFKKVSANLTSIFFAILIVYPLIFSTPDLISFWGSSYPVFNVVITSIEAFFLSILIFINLQEKSEVDSWKMHNLLFVIIINIIFVEMIFIWLTS